MKIIILCGGSGKRLWPLSSESAPKQFLKLFNGKSLFEKTVSRNLDISNDFIFIVNQKQLSTCKEQVSNELKDRAHFLIEPCGRNTAPAIALAALASNPDETLLVLPSDHLINNINSYKNCLNNARKLAEQGNLVTFGIKPNHPNTEFGYIEADGLNVKTFTEKPNADTARQYISSGNYYWNSGMFCFKAGLLLSELREHSPQILHKCNTAFLNTQSIQREREIKLEDMKEIPSESIDYALMEKSKNIKVIPSDFEWFDLGTFETLKRALIQEQVLVTPSFL